VQIEQIMHFNLTFLNSTFFLPFLLVFAGIFSFSRAAAAFLLAIFRSPPPPPTPIEPVRLGRQASMLPSPSLDMIGTHRERFWGSHHLEQEERMKEKLFLLAAGGLA
jgi:hypothetical protein